MMADNGSLRSPNLNYRQLTSSFFSTPRLIFTNLVSKASSTESEYVMGSPTSILDTKPFSSSAAALKNPFNHSDSKTTAKSKNLWDKLDTKGLVEALADDKPDSNYLSKPDRGMVLFGSQLKIQVPNSVFHHLNESSPPRSPGDFGIKTRNSDVLLSPFSPGLSPSSLRRSMFGFSNSGGFNGLSPNEMELAEDYTCVISHGPNPKTKHIFDDCIVESTDCSVVKLSESRRENDHPFTNRATSYPSDSFLSFCYTCKKQLGQGKDTYMYRGEKAFCSSDCRYKEMMLEEDDLEISSLDDVYGVSS